jgi:hypothetical protein
VTGSRCVDRPRYRPTGVAPRPPLGTLPLIPRVCPSHCLVPKGQGPATGHDVRPGTTDRSLPHHDHTLVPPSAAAVRRRRAR